MIKVSKICHSQNGTQEPFELSYSASDFEGLDLVGPVEAKGQLLRVEEGVMMVLEELNATQNTFCARCGKKLTLPLEFTKDEWLFYEEKPLNYDDENEMLFIDKHHWELNPFEPIRQELILWSEDIVRCPENCVVFEESTSEEGKKALAGLKDLLQ